VSIQRLLIANRGEAALRIARSAADLGIHSTAIYSHDDRDSRHCLAADDSVEIPGEGPAAYLDAEQIVRLALEKNCDAIHPGWGFLSENGNFAQLCADNNLTFIGPDSGILRLLGDKSLALSHAEQCGIPVAARTASGVSREEILEFARQHDSIIIKAVAGGGGKGMRIVRRGDSAIDAFDRCASEAKSAFGDERLYAEKYFENARHIEVQIVGDGKETLHLNERDCTLQRNHQKLVEICPAPNLSDSLRSLLFTSALRFASTLKYKGLCTIEFLVREKSGEIVFIEANPRLQVEHTVTEETTGFDLVALQLRIAGGSSLSDLGLFPERPPAPSGFAIQMRINTETLTAEGSFRPSGGVISVFEIPAGPGIRVDSACYSGYRVHPLFDSLAAKLIVKAKGDFSSSLARAYRALCEFRIEGVQTNLTFLQNLLQSKEVFSYDIDTSFVDRFISEKTESRVHRRLFFETPAIKHPVHLSLPEEIPFGTAAIESPMAGRIVEVDVREGDEIRIGTRLAVLSAMKMEHLVTAQISGFIEKVLIESGESVIHGQSLFYLRPADIERGNTAKDESIDPAYIRPDLREVLERHRVNMDEARPQAVSKRHKRSQRTARENIADLCDPGSFTEIGSLALAAQRRRRTVEELIKLSPADGLVAGFGQINGEIFGEEKSRSAVMSYDYTVFSGTQGAMNHKKTDRLLNVVEQLELPVVVFTEGGGGRPGEVDVPAVAGLDLSTFRQYGKLSGLVPRIAIASGRCFAGNAALFGSSDITIATEDATIGMGGPVMIKGGGLGSFKAEEVGPSDVQTKNGVIDILVKDEKEAVVQAKMALSYFQGRTKQFDSADQRLLRLCVPENRLRIYDMRSLISTFADSQSFLELRRHFAPGMITGFLRIDGFALGLIANDPSFLSGAIDADGADKASRFMQLCDAFDLPILTLCDTPGFMVGPEVESKALVRHSSRMFLTAASVSVPFFTIVIRKGYGLGAMAMAGGSFHATAFTVSWPTGEFGAMGLEGEVRTGFQKELADVKDWKERQKLFDKLVGDAYERGKAINMASYLEIDAVIDPAETRKWIRRGLASMPPLPQRRGKKRPMVDSW